MKKFLLAAVLALFPGFSLAQNCSTPPTCASLGFIYTAAQCGSLGTKCPFDTSKYFCEHPNRNAAVGNYFFEDGTVSTSSSANGKTAIGVVIKAPSSDKRGVVAYISMFESSYFNADQACTSNNLRGPIGHWRLPTAYELSNMLDDKSLYNKLSALGITEKSECYWSGSSKDLDTVTIRTKTNHEDYLPKNSEKYCRISCVGEF